jgi:Zn-dependent protease
VSESLVPQLLLVAFFLLVGFPVHEFAHAFVAYRLGDGTAKLFGRLTLNPIAHFDPLGALMLAISALSGTGFLFGWAKPTPVNPANLRDRRNGEVAVALAGPLSNLLMAAVGALVYRLVAAGPAIPDQVAILLFLFVVFNVGLAVINLIPIPPLDGAALLFRFLPYETAWRIRPLLAQWGIAILLVIVLLGGPVIQFVMGVVTSLLLGVF